VKEVTSMNAIKRAVLLALPTLALIAAAAPRIKW
jgi:hypothetical protein